MTKAQLLKTYHAIRINRVGNDAIWHVQLLDGRIATIRVHAMAGKLTAIKAALPLEKGTAV